MGKHHLFEEFPPTTSEEWRAKIETDLKGADFDRKLVWRTIEGFNVQPYYRLENLENKRYLDVKPNNFPFIRGHKTQNNDWFVCQDFDVTKDLKETNKTILDALMRGITSIHLVIEDESVLSTLSDFELLFEEIELTAIEINFRTKGCYGTLIKNFIQFVEQRGTDKNLLLGSFNIDPLAYLSTKGTSQNGDIQKDYCQLAEWIQLADQDLPKFHILAINSNIFPDSGSSITQEMAFLLAMADEYFANLTEHISIDIILKHLRLNIGVSANYFMEIAKVRALRFLWAKLVEAYQPSDLDLAKVFIHATNSHWNKTIYDPYVNMLRVTTETMSAVIGGIDSFTVLPFNTVYEHANGFSDRIARNTQIILKEEAYFDKVIDPSAGSYYIEELTETLIEKAWNMVLEVEEKGGYYKALEEGFIQSLVEEMAQKREVNIANKKEILLGTNQYANVNETVLNDLKLKEEKIPEGPAIKPLKRYRGGEAFEHLRFEVERAEKTPEVFMFTYGPLAMRKARSQFSGNFFSSAGYKINDNNGFKTVEEGVKAFRESGSDVLVVCSSDDEYINIVPPIMDAVGKETIVVVAGNPKDSIDELKAKGVEFFIHVRSNVLETLKIFNQRLIHNNLQK